MEDKTYTVEKNELLQKGTIAIHAPWEIEKEIIVLTAKTDGLFFGLDYYVEANKPVTSDVTCYVNIVSLGQAGGTHTAIIKKGETRSNYFAHTTFYKLYDLFDFVPKSDNVTQYVFPDYEQKYNVDEIIAQNLLYDFRNGIREKALTVDCADLTDLNGKVDVDWDKGEILQADQIIYDNKENSFWRVTGRKFRKEGAPFVDLELQQTFGKE